jgi:hypothetical protein
MRRAPIWGAIYRVPQQAAMAAAGDARTAYSGWGIWAAAVVAYAVSGLPQDWAPQDATRRLLDAMTHIDPQWPGIANLHTLLQEWVPIDAKLADAHRCAATGRVKDADWMKENENYHSFSSQFGLLAPTPVCYDASQQEGIAVTWTDDQVVADWLATHRASTQRVYRPVVEAFRQAMGKPLPAVTTADIVDWLQQWRRQKPATQARKLRTLRSLYRHGQRVARWPHNPCYIPDPVVPDALPSRLPADDALWQLLQAAQTASPKLAALVAFIFGTGARMSDVVATTWGMIETTRPEGWYWTVPQRTPPVTLPLRPEVVAALQTWRRVLAQSPATAPTPSRPLFPNRHGDPSHCIWPNRNGQFGHRFSPVLPLRIPQNGH